MVAILKICLAAATAVATGASLAAPSQNSPLAKFTQLKQLPLQWSAQGRARGSAMIKAHIGLRQNNIKGLQEALLDISDPDSPNYGKWLTKEQVDEYSAPAETDVAAVKAWLTGAGITEVSQPTNDWLEFTVPVSKLESLLATKYNWYIHADTGSRIPRTTEFSIPQDLHSIIDVVTPTTAFYSNIAPHTYSDSSDPFVNFTNPAWIRSTYNVDYNSTGSQVVATTGFLGIGANHTDFAAFSRQFVPGLKDFKDISVNGGSNSGDGSQLEGNLDTQYAGGIAHPNPSEYLATAPTGDDEPTFNDALLAFANHLNSHSNPPSAVSTSYGGEERLFDGAYMDRICNELMKAGCRGVSVFFSSGDYGVGGTGEASCSDGYYGQWPATCPYVTSVGGTDFNSFHKEVVANFSQYTGPGHSISPGGGFSEHFAAPAYSKSVTTAYADSLSSSQRKLFNATNRGYPDISLISVKYLTHISGQVAPAVGTSASTPSVAGLVSLLNDYRHSKGRPNLGFLNPLLYSDATVKAAIRDVTSGSNPGCDSDGFPAKRGWDAASGLGSFDFGKLRSLI